MAIKVPLMQQRRNLVGYADIHKGKEKCLLIISIKKLFRHKAAIIITATVILSAAVILSFCFRKETEASGIVGYRVEDKNDALALARMCCENVSPAPVACGEITIPTEWSGAYQEYQQLQKKSGFDLEPFRGRKCTRYTLTADAEDPEGGRTVTLLVCAGTLIGGDVSEMRSGGGTYPLTLL